MSQTVRFTEINGAFYPEVFTGFPERDEAISMVEDMVEDGAILPSDDYYEVVAEWYEIGDGECGMHTFFSEEDLIEWHNKGNFMEKVKAAGYTVEHIQSHTIRVNADDVEIQGEDEDQ